MTPLATTVILGLSLSVDSFAAALGKSAGQRRIDLLGVFAIALCFGAVQAAILAAGWGLGETVSGLLVGSVIQEVDHWVAFVLLAVVGGKMIRDGWSAGEAASARPLRLATLLVAAVATSIDAAAVGFTLPFVGIPVAEAAVVVGASTFLLSVAGAALGRVAGPLLGRRAEAVGGLVLLALGAKILAEHLAA